MESVAGYFDFRGCTPGSIIEHLLGQGKRKRRPDAKSHFVFESIMKVEADYCVNWPLFRTDKNYGYLSYKDRPYPVYALVCEAVHGPRPTGGVWDASHECGNNSCVNKRHISWKTRLDNIRDKHRHGTMAKGEMIGSSLLTEAAVREIRAYRGPIKGHEALAEKFGVGLGTVRDVVYRKSWRHVQ